MSRDDDETADLARRFLDLWQAQMRAWLADPALARWASRGGLPALPGWPFDEGIGGDAGGGTAAAGPAPRARDRRLDELARRLDACEARLARLESGAAAGPGRKARRRRS